jgi:hypothetical protein
MRVRRPNCFRYVQEITRLSGRELTLQACGVLGEEWQEEGIARITRKVTCLWKTYLSLLLMRVATMA